jgi:hypothetical protein
MPPLWLLSQKSRTSIPTSGYLTAVGDQTQSTSLCLLTHAFSKDSKNLSLSRNQSPIINCIPMSPRNQRISRQIPTPYQYQHHSPQSLLFLQYLRVKKGQHLKSTRGIPPIPHKIHRNPKHPHEMHTRLLHTPISIRSELIGECTAGIRVGPYIVAGVAERKSEEGCAWLGVLEFDRLERRTNTSLQTSVTIPARMIWFFPVAWTAARKSALSHASTSPWRWMKGAVGCICLIRFEFFHSNICGSYINDFLW